MAIAALVAISCVIASARRLTSVSRGPGAQVVRWAELVRSSRAESARERLHVAALSDDALSELVTALETAPSHDAAIAELNERALELDRVLDVGAVIPISAARIALFSGTASAMGVVATTGGDATALPTAMAAFGAGLAGGVCSIAIGRVASERSRAQRTAWAELQRSLERALPE